MQPETRRRLIVEAAFKALAAEGFEGLRTRDIATAVGINSATLHHYFPTKEDLVAAVADRLEERLRAEKSAETSRQTSPALKTFDGQFEDVIFYQLEKPDILAVYRELVARAPRDPAIRTLVKRLHASWKAGMVAALRQGLADGSLRADLDPEAVAGLVISTAWGLVADIFTSRSQLEVAAQQLRAWIVPA